jgi:AcrR family transcriptional regulator
VIETLSLRERKKRDTRELIAEAAYEIVRERGADSLTADAIAERAGVSRRTFFNYFPTVESALVPVVAGFLEHIDEQLAATEVTGPLMAALARLVREGEELPMIERFTVIGLTAMRSEGHHSLLHQCSREWLDDFAATLRSRIGGPDDEAVDELYVYGAATALISAAEASLRVWIQRTDGELTPETLRLRQELLAEAIERLGTGFDAATDPGSN